MNLSVSTSHALYSTDEYLLPKVIGNGTTHVRKHWYDVHNVQGDGQQRSDNPVISGIKKGVKYSGSLLSIYNNFAVKILMFLVMCLIPPNALIAHGAFKDLVRLLSKDLADMLPGVHLVRQWLLAKHIKEKRYLRRELRDAKSKIHVSFDLWTSPNYYALCAIVVHYIDCNSKRQQRLLAIRPVYGEHSGVNIAQTILTVFSEFRIGCKIGYFVTDNAQNNDTAIDAVIHALYPAMLKPERDKRRLRCLGHVVNLCAQAFILGKNAEEDLLILETAHASGDIDKIAKYWSSVGALGRLHHLIRYIRMTPQRRQEFAACVSTLADELKFNMLEVSHVATMDDFRGSRGLRALPVLPRSLCITTLGL